tara:strand:- start:904 stop:1119 length:216 start_codon:yes stop_codon:yes gene_type:complete
MIFQTNETLIRPDWNLIRGYFLVLSIFLLGVALGSLLNNNPTDPVGFATLEDMSFLVEELRECKGGIYGEL